LTETKTISGYGTGHYNCDGADDQEVINKALAWAAAHPGNRVHLEGPFEYQITNQVLFGSDTIFSGDPTAILKIPDMACGTSVDDCVFPDGTPVLTSLPGTVTKNLILEGFSINGNCQHQALNLGYARGKPSSSGSGVERLIGIRGIPGGEKASNIQIHNMNFYDSFGEAAHILYAEDVQIYNNAARNHQHDAFFLIEVSGKNIFRKCRIEGITDGCARWDNCANWEIYENQFLAYTGANNNTAYMLGQNGIQIANESNKPSITRNIEVYNNKFIGPNLCGIWLNDGLANAGKTPQDVWIHNNYFSNCGWRDTSPWSGGISAGPWGNGIVIDHNTFEGCYNNSIQFNSVITPGCVADISYNNILSTKGSRTNSTTGPSIVGYGIANLVQSGMTVHAECNFISDSKAGNYYNLTPGSESKNLLPFATIDIAEDPNAMNVIITCLENEVDSFTQNITQDYTVYRKV
jgi:hypothetical protein